MCCVELKQSKTQESTTDDTSGTDGLSCIQLPVIVIIKRIVHLLCLIGVVTKLVYVLL